MRVRPAPRPGALSHHVGAAAVSCVLLALTSCAHSSPASQGAAWRRAHSGVDRSLLRAVDWPGTTTSRVEGDAHGFRTVLKFPGDDADMGAIAEVAPADADPCAAMPYFVSDTGFFHPDPRTYGHTGFTPVECTPLAKDTWTLTVDTTKIDAYAAYAQRRDGILLILTTYDTWTDPDFAAIAASLHPLTDADLGALA